MTTSDKEALPKRGNKHEALAVYQGDWNAEGVSYGGTDQSGADPRANGVPWTSRHTGRWHTGEFFLIQDERADIDGTVFDTLSMIGVDAQTDKYFIRSFENHGFYRHYQLSKDGDVWTLSGKTERASITFSDDNRKQTIVWEWKKKDKWLPLCDRVATKA